MEEPTKFCFTSDLFKISVGEDDETNTCCFGKELGNWLAAEMKELGFAGAEVIPEDWGWCVSCTNDPYHIFIACGCFVDHEKEYDPYCPPKGSEVTWQCFIGSDTPFFRNPFKKLDRTREKEIEVQVFGLLSETKGIIQVDEP